MVKYKVIGWQNVYFSDLKHRFGDQKRSFVKFCVQDRRLPSVKYSQYMGMVCVL